MRSNLDFLDSGHKLILCSIVFRLRLGIPCEHRARLKAIGVRGQIFVFAIFLFLRFWAGNGLTESREGFKKIPGGRRIHSG